MRRFAMLVLAAVLALAVATPALAKQEKKSDAQVQAETYRNASKAEKEKMRAAIEEKAAAIQNKRTDTRHQVDNKMQERLHNIEADSPGNIGPIGGRN